MGGGDERWEGDEDNEGEDGLNNGGRGDEGDKRRWGS